MLEWICPVCRREVPAGAESCPHCALTLEGSSAPTAGVRQSGSFWADVERGFRFGLGFVAVLALVYFILFLLAYFGDYQVWVDRLARWIRVR